MSQSPDLLDLSITLTPPPAGSPPEAIASIALRSGDLHGLTYAGDLLIDPLTDKERTELRWYLEEYWKWPYEQFLTRGKQVEALLPEIGKRLYDRVFGSVGAMKVLQAWRLQPGAARQVSIVSDIPRILSLPWELLHDEQGFLALRTRNPVSIVRHLPQHELAELATSFEPPLRVLLVTARPEGSGFIDPRSTARELLDEVQSQVETGAITLEFLRPPTLAALRKRLEDTTRPVHILHFDGHGIFEGEVEKHDGQRKLGGEQGKLAFENAEGKLDLVEAGMLAQVLQDSGVRLAVLDACQSAMGAADDAFSSVAMRLIQGGVDAVVAMSASLLVASSTRYFERFYQELLAGTSAPTAQERARQALHDDPRRHLLRRRRDEEATPVELRDWWLPHFYQQRPLVLQATSKPAASKPKSKPKQPPPGMPTSRLNKDMPAEPRYGFSGRAYELLQLERHLLRGKLVVIHGFGGVGKTALVREAADWLTRTGMYAGACFVSFEHGGDSASLLSALGNFLEVYDGNYNPNDKAAALARLKPALRKQPTLVIADNLESILSGGEAPLDTAIRTQLWDVLLELAKLGAGVLLTSRDTSFGDGRLARGARTAHLELKGLYREDAYLLATRLLTDLGVDRARAPYADLRDLLVQLDHHPLAIQLVLPALRTFPLAIIRADFAALLPKFVDDTETGRNRSLLASLADSLRRLSEEQRTLLPRLALFEGGASEDDLLTITQIPESKWARLRPALEQAALVTAEQVHEEVTVPFLRFHPVLTPYLRTQSGADDAILRERYTLRYSALANYLYYEDRRHPQPVRALVRRELPNLGRALELLLEAGNAEAASRMIDCMVRFLDLFGMGRERDELRQRLAKMLAIESTQKGAMLTRAEWLREIGLGEDDFGKGHLRAAYTRFTDLLTRIETQPEGAPLGGGSYEHFVTLRWFARCLLEGGQPAVAEKRFRETLAILDTLLMQYPDHQILINSRGGLMTDLGDVFSRQGQYLQAQRAYQEALKIAQQQGNPSYKSVVLTQLGALALEQGNYAEARVSFTKSLEITHALGELEKEAFGLHNLGMVAEAQKEWEEAEQYFRESLAIKERLGNAASAATTCNQLAVVALGIGHPVEAEGWFKRAIELAKSVQSGSLEISGFLNNLARLLTDEVKAGRLPMLRLAEARDYAEQALAIREGLGGPESWNNLSTLAKIADMEGHIESAQDYRRRERETFAAFAGNRYHIDRQHSQLIAAIAAAAKGDAQAREAVEAVLSEFEVKGWHITAATQRILAGERDWHSLVEDLNRVEALLVLRVLETIAQPTPEEIIASLPSAIRVALESGDTAALEQAFQALSPEEQRKVEEAMSYLQARDEETEGKPG